MSDPWNTEPESEAASPAPVGASAKPVPVPFVQPVGDAQAPRRVGDVGGLRVVIVVWCFWLLGAWAAAWLSDTSVPRVRWMLFAGSFGLMLVWPAFRLSQRVGPDEPGRGALMVLLDWVAMIGVYQAVIWSLHLIAAWPFVRGAWLDGAVAAWSLLSALIVAAARLWPAGLARVVGMALCIALVFAEPVAIWLSVRGGGAGWAMVVSPIQAFWELTASGTSRVAPWDRRVMMVALVAGAGWSALGLWALGERVLGRARQPA